MSQIDELIIIIPVILNLKGNLEMNLSARLGTAANIGELDNPKTRRAIIYGNLTLLQVQATVVSFVAAVVAFGLSRFMPRPVSPNPAAEGIVDAALDLRMVFARSQSQSRRPRPSPTSNALPGGLME